jgi:hypothetical protein
LRQNHDEEPGHEAPTREELLRFAVQLPPDQGEALMAMRIKRAGQPGLGMPVVQHLAKERRPGATDHAGIQPLRE